MTELSASWNDQWSIDWPFARRARLIVGAWYECGPILGKTIKTSKRTCATFLEILDGGPFLLHAANICASKDRRIPVGGCAIAQTRDGTSHALGRAVR